MKNKIKYFTKEALFGDVVFYEVIKEFENSNKSTNSKNKNICIFDNEVSANEYAKYLNLIKNRKILFLPSKTLEFIKEHNKNCKSHGAAGEHYEFLFKNDEITVKCFICKKEFSVSAENETEYFIDKEFKFDPMFYSVFNKNNDKPSGLFYSIEEAEIYANYKTNEEMFKSGSYFLLTEKMTNWINRHENKCSKDIVLNMFPTGIVEFQSATCSKCNSKCEDDI